MNIIDILKSAGIDLSDPKAARELAKASKVARSESAGATEAETLERQRATREGLLSIVRGNVAGFQATPTGDAASQLTVRCIVNVDGSRAAVAKLKIAGVQAPAFVDLLTGDATSEGAYETAKRPRKSRTEVGE